MAKRLTPSLNRFLVEKIAPPSKTNAGIPLPEKTTKLNSGKVNAVVPVHFADKHFVDAFLLRMKNKKELLMNKKIWSRRSSILPEFVGCSVRIYNGKTHVPCKITEDKVGHKFGEFALTRKRRVMKTNKK